MPPFACLITGANRGIGFALAAQYLLRDNTVVVAAVRDLKSATSLSLQELPRGTGSSVVLIPYDSASEQTIGTGINLLRDEKGVTHLDVVIANAGITQSKRCQMLDVDVAELNRLAQTNSFGPLFLFRQTLPLMRQSKLATGAKFINIGSATGSSTKAEIANALQLAPMGVSKACK
jgi:norsolorinic acid ketoreductase